MGPLPQVYIARVLPPAGKARNCGLLSTLRGYSERTLSREEGELQR
jgi:hypothetical protein